MSEYLLMSIKTKYEVKIFNGTKTYEFRRKSIGEKNLNKRVYIYSSEVKREIVGYVVFDEILSGSAEYLVNKTNYDDMNGIIEYFDGSDGYALHIREYYKFVRPIKLNEIKNEHVDFVIPQFYRYLNVKESIYDKLINRNVIHHMKLQSEYFDYILYGDKRYELRLNDEKRKKINYDDIIIFSRDGVSDDKLITLVRGITKRNSFDEIIDEQSMSLLASKDKKKEELLSELDKFYSKEKQMKYGVLAIRIEIVYFIGSKLDKKLIDDVYEFTKDIEKYYSDYKEWFYNKHIKEKNRKTIYIKNNCLIGIINLKKEEKKICTIYVKDEYRRNGISDILLEEAFKYLGTMKPYITIHKDNLKYFKDIIKRYNWRKCGNINDEILFNKEEL